MFIPGFDIIKGIAVDCMHFVLLGVTKMLMTLWFDKTHASEDWNVSKHVENVDSRLLNITLPNCISRAPRSIAKDHPHWKASDQYNTFNVHCLLHLHDCVNNIAPFWASSCFWFEDYNGELRILFHGTQKMESQVAFSV
ncbi:unnamed protein product, partial [Porites evermanni]